MLLYEGYLQNNNKRRKGEYKKKEGGEGNLFFAT
jgi:hypothetical protein